VEKPTVDSGAWAICGMCDGSGAYCDFEECEFCEGDGQVFVPDEEREDAT
jgi:DnaJ-class molecular chaperone